MGDIMKISEIKSLIELVAYLLLGILPMLGLAQSDYLAQTLLYVFLTVLALSYFCYRLFVILKQHRLETQAMSNNSVIKNARKHCKTLLRYANASEKKLLKYKKIKDIKRSRDEEDRIIKKLVGFDELEEQKKKVNKRIQRLRQQYSDRQTILLIKDLTEEQDYKISQLMSNTFMKLERILLNAEQFDLRIKFGKYIKTFSDIEEQRIRACIDFIGWTYMMMGEVSKAEKAIESGINKAKKVLQETTDEKTMSQMNNLICRAYRHLGSARRTYENEPEKALGYLKEALTYSKNIVASNNDQQGLTELEVGIHYGIAASEFYIYYGKHKNQDNTDQTYLEFYKQYQIFQQYISISKDFANQHRYVKFLILKSKYLELFLDHHEHFKKHVGNDFSFEESLLKNEIASSLEIVEDVFKKNIFLDEAVEHYLEENVKLLKYQVIDTLKE